jgi:hemolysin activation/secretion protein
MKKFKLFALSALTLNAGVMAATPPATGGALQQLAPSPTLPAPAPKVVIQRSTAPAASDTDTTGLKIVVKTLKITGSQAYAEGQLIALTGFKSGSALTLTELRGMANLISRYYQDNGYVVAQVYLPPQDINDGAVTITVNEGRYGKILVRNQTNVASTVVTDLLEGLSSGDVVISDALESKLLLVSDLPGVRVNSALVPGAVLGETDLMVDVLPEQRVSGSVDADNAGNRYSGTFRLGATINLNEPLGQGDVATLRLLTAGAGLNHFRASYQMHIGRLRVGAAYNSLEYALGKEFKSLLANGTAYITSFYGSYPLLRSHKTNLYAGLSFDSKRFQDRMDSVGAMTEKSAHTLTASLNGDHRDSLGGGGHSNYGLTWTTGNISILTPAARALDAATVQSNGPFSKLGFNASRLQSVNKEFSLFAGISGQIGSKNLDISEKMELGGLYGVRAYPEGEAYADRGYLVNLEARLKLPQWAPTSHSEFELTGFVDTGTVILNTNPWTAGPNKRTLSAAGVALNWSELRKFSVRATYAHKLGGKPTYSGPDASGRLWLQALKYF